MATGRYGFRRTGVTRPWWRPIAYSVATAAAIAALFSPVPAFATPAVPQAPPAPAVPDAGSRPTALGTVALPGQTVRSTPTASAIPGSSTNPVLQKIEKGRAEIATLGDRLIQLGQDRDLAAGQLAAATERFQVAENALRQAQTDASTAAGDALRTAAAMPPGALDPGLVGLGDLTRLQQGSGSSSASAPRQLESAQINAQVALDEQTTAAHTHATAVARYATLNATLVKKQAAQQKLELANRSVLQAAEISETAQDSRLGAGYLQGEAAGRGADPRAVQALEFALSQRGKPYVWSTEGPDTYDCSGLMWKSYQVAGFQLERVSRDQYWQTRDKVVDRYSLLPGDLLFFSYSNSWRGIHHVAMYAGNGMMVEAPQTGLNVRLVPVRWTRLFQATRVFGSVEGTTPGPALGEPDPEPTGTTHTPSPTTKPPSSPATTKPPSSPPSHPSTTPSTPTHSPSGTPSSSSPTPTPGPSSSTATPSPSTTPSPSSSGTATHSPSASITPSPSKSPTPAASATKSASSPASSSTNPSRSANSSRSATPSRSTTPSRSASASRSAPTSGSASAAK
jgi:peptidoglycan DL-endopeptidase CwlO